MARTIKLDVRNTHGVSMGEQECYADVASIANTIAGLRQTSHAFRMVAVPGFGIVTLSREPWELHWMEDGEFKSGDVDALTRALQRHENDNNS